MNHTEMVSLLREGVGQGGIWADLGAGQGNFTRALRELAGDKVIIHAIDQDANALRHNTAADHVHVGDFTQMDHIPDLPDGFDGVLMTNALHWTRNQEALVRAIYDKLRDDGRLLIVEYAVSVPRPFMIPYPVPFPRFETLAQENGFSEITQIATRTSPRNNSAMYAAAAIK